MFKKTLIFQILCLTIFSNVYCNENLKDTTTSLTKAHLNINSTRLFIIPPEGFEMSNSFLGLKKGNDFVIQIFDLDGGNFKTNTRNASVKYYEDKGLKVHSFQEFKMNGFSAIYSHVQGVNNIVMHQLIFGDSTFSVMLIGAYPFGEEKIGDQIKESLFSSYYDKSFIADPLSSAAFTFDTSNSKFKLYKTISNIFTYTIDGKENIDKFSTMFMISQFPGESNYSLQNVYEVFITNLEKYGFVLKSVDKHKEKVINKKLVLEKIVSGTLNGKDVKLYYLIYQTNEQFISFSGTSYSETNEDILEFERLAETIVFK